MLSPRRTNNCDGIQLLPESCKRFLIRLTGLSEDQEELLWEVRGDIERLGGVATDDGFMFETESRRDFVAEFLSDNLGDGYFDTVDAPNETNMQILIAAPDTVERAKMATYFLRRGCSVQVINDAVSAMDAVSIRYPEAMIIDGQLLWGGADGLLACLREAPLFSHVPVLVLCEVYQQNHSAFRDSPVVGCFQKPFRFEDVFTRLRSPFRPEAGTDDTSRTHRHPR